MKKKTVILQIITIVSQVLHMLIMLLYLILTNRLPK